MGKRGPKPTPTKTLKLRGSWRAETRKGEPQPELGLPIMPRTLRAEAKLVWKRIVPKLAAMGVLAAIDGEALARYCTMAVRYWKAERFLELNGDTYAARDGEKKRPQVGIATDLNAALARIEASFGLSPSSRTSIRTEPTTDGKKDGTAALLKLGKSG